MPNRWLQDVPGGRWGALRGLAIAMLILGHCTQAIPFPSGPSDKHLEEGDWRAEDLELWHGWTARVLPVDKAFFDRVVIGAFRGMHLTGKVVRAPVRPLFIVTKTNQQWGLFARVSTSPDALVVEVRQSGEWLLVEERLHPTADWHDEQFKYRRLRGIWDLRQEPKGHYKNFTKWVARMAFADFPEVDRVKIYLRRKQISTPWEPEDPEREIKFLRSHKRENHQ